MKFLWRFFRRWFAPKTIVLELPAAEEDEFKTRPPTKPQSPLKTLFEESLKGPSTTKIADDDFMDLVSEQISQGKELETLQWLKKFSSLKSISTKQKVTLERLLAEHHQKRGDNAIAQEHWKNVLTTIPNDMDALSNVAMIYQREGDVKNASHFWQKVYLLDAHFPNIGNRLSECATPKPPLVHSVGPTVAGLNTASFNTGRYRLMRELGRGGNGVVYLANDNELDRPVAVKILHPHLASNKLSKHVTRFFAEAKTTAGLRHPNIVAIYDLNQDTRQLVMEPCLGGTLKDHLRNNTSFSLLQALKLHCQLLSALEVSHAKNIAHLDIKPANLMFRDDPAQKGAEIVLGDFGVAHLANTKEDSNALSPQKWVGTLAYMAPEQRRGSNLLKSDVFTAAVVLVEILSGTSPTKTGFNSKEYKTMLEQINFPKESASEQKTAFSSHLMACLSPEPNERPSAKEALTQARWLHSSLYRSTFVVGSL